MKPKVLSILATRWRQLVGFALMFRVLESLLFAPLASLAGTWLLGRTVLDSTAVVSFILSPRGFLALVLAAVTALTIRLIEHAGLSAIFFGGLEGRVLSAGAALRLVYQRLLTLARVATRFVAAGFLIAMPLLVAAGASAAWLFSRHDVNYYLKLRPPEFTFNIAVLVILALGTAAVFVSVIVRWRWVVQAVLFQQLDARRAFAESTALTRGLRVKLTLLLLAVVLVSIASSLVASLLGSLLTAVVIKTMGGGQASLAISFGLLLALRTIIGAVCTLFASCVDAGIFTSAFQRRVLDLGRRAILEDSVEVERKAASGWIPAALGSALILFAAGGTWLAQGAIWDQPAITIHAHRGVSIRAPENTLAAAREAIAAGADYLETDVQLTRDDVLVVAHDSDFSRLAGVAKKVWDLTYDEIRSIPLGGRSAPEFRNECAPTFDALLAETKGRIKLNIELKYYGDHQPGLARKVVEALRARGMLQDVVIQCLEYEPLLEVRQLAPEVPVGYLLAFNARKPSRLDVDFLSVEQNRLDRAFILSAHRRQQLVYAWTVNTTEDTERLFDLGIDGVITDQTELVRKALHEYLARPEAERAVRRVRSWLAQ